MTTHSTITATDTHADLRWSVRQDIAEQFGDSE